MKRQRAPGVFAEHPVEREGVEVEIRVQPAARALQHGDRARAPSVDAACAGARA